MIEVTLEAVQRRQWCRVGGLRAALDGAVVKVMEGRHDAESAAIAHEAIAALRARRLDGIVLGCSEIALLLKERADEPDLVDPIQLLAEAALRHALVQGD